MDLFGVKVTIQRLNPADSNRLIFSSTSKPSCCTPGPVASNLMIKAFPLIMSFQLTKWLLPYYISSIFSIIQSNQLQQQISAKMTKPPRKPRAKPTMHKPKRLCQNQLSICKKAEILRRILYDKVRLQDICDEFDLPASTVCTWKKNSNKILADSVKVGKKRIRMCHSKYKDVELALLYWIKDMRSRDHPPPLSKGILKAKAEQ